MSKLENLVAAQHPRAKFTQTAGDFGHGQFHLSRFQMGDVDLARAFELAQFGCQHARTQVLGEFGEPRLAVGKRAFDDQMAQVVDPVDRLPEGVARPGIAGEGQAAGTRIQPVPPTAGTVWSAGSGVKPRPPSVTGSSNSTAW
jgi:hypothetical protein